MMTFRSFHRLAAAVLFCWASLPAHADLYERGDSGDFSDPKWINESTTPPTPDSGPPGSGDTALIDGGSSATITASGGSVDKLEGTSNFSVTGAFSANSLSYSGLIMGAGTLMVKTVLGSSPFLLTISGGNVVAGTMAEDFMITSGSLKVTAFTGKMANLSGGSADLDNAQTNLGISIMTGGQLTVPNLVENIGQSLSVDGGGSLLHSKGSLKIFGSTLDISGGAGVTADLDLEMDGAPLSPSSVGSGGHWTGANTLITVSGAFTVGNSLGTSALQIDGGAVVSANNVFFGAYANGNGSVTLSGSGSGLQVGGGLGIGVGGVGELQIQDSASLSFSEGATVPIGLEAKSMGTLTADGASTVIDARQVYLGVGIHNGSKGTFTLTNGATLKLGRSAIAGEGGNGQIEANSGSAIQVTDEGPVNAGAAAELVVGAAKAGPGDFGALSIQDSGSTFSSALPVTVGRDAGSNGGLGVTGSFALNRNLIVGESGIGSINEAAQGQITVSGSKTIAHFGENAKSKGDVYIQDSGTLLKLDQIAEVYFGNGGEGSLNITGGAVANYVSPVDANNANSGHLAFGLLAGSDGVLTVDGAGSAFTSAALLFIGSAGKASWKITNGGSVSTELAVVAAEPGSSASITVDGAGSSWTNTDNLVLGGKQVYAPTSGGHAQLTVSNGATMTSGPVFRTSYLSTVTITGGQILIASETDNFGPSGSLRIGKGGTLLGRGLIDGQLIVGLGGKLNPGGDPGLFAVQGDLSEEAGSETDIELGGKNAGAYDQLKVSGAATLNGTLNVTLVNGYNPGPNDRFTIVTASSVTGAFTQVNGAEVTYGANSITVKPKIVPETLTVTVSPTGGGSVTAGFLGSSPRNDGFTYTVTATPAHGMSFAGWTGGLTSDSARLTFQMQPGLTLQANFVASPFAGVAGAYRGLAVSSANGDQGLLILSVLATGAYTGKFMLNGVSYALTGQFTGAGALQQTVIAGAHTLVLNLQLALTGTPAITGTITADGAGLSVTAAPSAYSAQSPAPQAGAFTLYLPNNSADDANDYPPPSGSGWATVAITKTGLITITGRLPDNTALSSSGSLSAGGTFVSYASLYGGNGFLAGALTFNSPPFSTTSASDVSGNLAWSSPGNSAAGAVFPAPFTTTLQIAGSFYTPPPRNSRVLPGLDAQGDASLQFTGGGLSNSITKAITITEQNAVRYTPASPADKLTMTFTTSNGAFSGTFYSGAKQVPFSGVVRQAAQTGQGFFLGTQDTGVVQLSP